MFLKLSCCIAVKVLNWHFGYMYTSTYKDHFPFPSSKGTENCAVIFLPSAYIDASLYAYTRILRLIKSLPSTFFLLLAQSKREKGTDKILSTVFFSGSVHHTVDYYRSMDWNDVKVKVWNWIENIWNSDSHLCKLIFVNKLFNEVLQNYL